MLQESQYTNRWNEYSENVIVPMAESHSQLVACFSNYHILEQTIIL